MFYEHELNGLPVMRPMLANYPTDVNSFKLDSQYMLSDVLLVAPVMAAGARTVNVHFPLKSSGESELWYDIDDYSITSSTSETKTITVDAKKTPVYQRGGTILPRKETIRKASAYMKNDPITLFVAVDNNKQASGTLFIDDEESYEYRNGNYLYLNLSFANDILTNKFIDDYATYNTIVELERVVVAGLSKIPSYATLKLSDGTTSRLEIINVTDNSFAFAATGAKMMEEWEIALSGVSKAIISTALILMVVAVNFIN